MPDPPINPLNARTFTVAELVSSVRDGRIRVPRFQRPLRWLWEDVRRLFDSIVRGYPIGSVLLWDRAAPSERIVIGALEIDAPNYTSAYWVVDGQQRITSLANALSDNGAHDSRFSLAYDLRRARFDRVAPEDPYRIALPVLFDLPRLLKWFAARPEIEAHLDEATRVTTAIRQYTVPAYVVTQNDESVLTDIFDRLNNTGRRLSRAEVFSAFHSGTEAANQPQKLSDIANNVDSRLGFGRIDEDTILRAFLARRGPDVSREIRSEFERSGPPAEFHSESADDAHRGAEAALCLAVAFLQNDARVPHFAFLPYRYLLIVLTRFFAHYPAPATRNRELLRRWFWRAAMLGPSVARGAYTSAMRTLAGCIAPNDESGSISRLVSALGSINTEFIFPTQFRVTMAEVRFVLCALWSLEPRDTTTGDPYERAVLSSTLGSDSTATASLEMFFPRAGPSRNKAGNRVFTLGDESDGSARARFAEKPRRMDGATWLATLRSHAISDDSSRSLQEGNGEEFISQRDESIHFITLKFLSDMSEIDFEDTPPLDDLEVDEDSTDGKESSR